MVRFRGCGTALATPFTENEVDYAALEKIVELQVSGGINFLVPLGSTAETPCLEDEEKAKILSLVRSLAPELPILAGVGTNSLRATIRNIRFLEPFGADAYLVVVPYYNKPTQEGMYQYFKAVAESTDKGIVLYNVPGRTGINMKAETTLRVAEIPNVIAVKEASGDIAQILEIIKNKPEGFSVFSGNDDQTLELMKGGADGVISVASNLAPGLMRQLTDALLEGNFEKADALNARLSPLYDACFVESNPIPVKAGLSIEGFCSAQMRLPMTMATPATFAIMRKTLAAL